MAVGTDELEVDGDGVVPLPLPRMTELDAPLVCDIEDLGFAGVGAGVGVVLAGDDEPFVRGILR